MKCNWWSYLLMNLIWSIILNGAIPYGLYLATLMLIRRKTWLEKIIWSNDSLLLSRVSFFFIRNQIRFFVLKGMEKKSRKQELRSLLFCFLYKRKYLSDHSSSHRMFISSQKEIRGLVKWKVLKVHNGRLLFDRLPVLKVSLSPLSFSN